MMSITLNGEQREIEGQKTVAELLRDLGIPAAGTAVAVDGAVIPSDSRANTTITDGQRIDVLRPIGGG